MKEGDRVTYQVPQHTRAGIITFIGHTEHGGDCRVKWDDTGNESEECLVNLIHERR